MVSMDTAANDELPPQAARLAPKLRALADQGVFFGTSSWKYEGWVGSIYSQDWYITRGKFSKAKFKADCLPQFEGLEFSSTSRRNAIKSLAEAKAVAGAQDLVE
jgi:hypothetical protein